MSSTTATTQPSPWRTVATIAIIFALSLYVYGEVARHNETLIGVVVLPILLMIVKPIFEKMGDAETEFDLYGLLLAGFGLKMAATFFRFLGGVDSVVYHKVGLELAEEFKRGNFGADTGRKIPGTGSVRYFTGLVEVLTGGSYFASYLVFSFLGFFGLVFFYRATVLAYPLCRRSRLAKLTFLWPSLLFWPSSIGKEALMLFSLGLATYGLANLFEGRTSGFAELALGVVGAGLIRPHVAGIMFAGAGAAYLVRRSSGGLSGAATKLVVVGCLAAGLFYANSAAQASLGVDGGGGGLTAALDQTEQQTGQGGAQFTPARVSSPAELPWAVVTVLFRPFPHEAHNVEALIASLESIVLLGFAVASVRDYPAVFSRIRREAYPMMAVGYVLTFSFLFSAVGNFGILTRQRAQVLPILFILLALPAAKSRVVPAARPMPVLDIREASRPTRPSASASVRTAQRPPLEADRRAVRRSGSPLRRRTTSTGSRPNV